jgi:hypothetical protein
MRKSKGYYRDRDKWKCIIVIDGKQKFIGYFDTEEMAHKAYVEACIEHGYENRINGYLDDENVRKRRLERANIYGKKSYIELKEEIIIAYGSICQCCGENNPEFLTIDHINEDGAKHRKEIGKSAGCNFYRWLRKNNYPKDNFQLLCYNCNCAKHRFGYCPHKLNRYQG